MSKRNRNSVIAYPKSQICTCTRTLLLYGHRTYCISPLLLQIAAENNVTIILPSHYTHTLQSTDKWFLGTYFKNEAAVCEITRSHKVRLIGFSWNKGVGVSGFELTDIIYPFNCNKVPKFCSPFLRPAKLKRIQKRHLQIWLWFMYPLLQYHTFCHRRN